MKMRQIKVYITSKREHAKFLSKIEIDGIHIISRWLWTAGRGDIPVTHWLTENFVDMANADYVVLYVEKDDDLNASLLELGAAMYLGKKILIAGERDFDQDGGVPHKSVRKWSGMQGVRITGTLEATLLFIKKEVLEHPDHWRR